MKREEFLKALEERLQVLNRQEREDIVSEYRQHIELRMESGEQGPALFMKISNGSAANVKPEMVLDAYYAFLGEERPQFAWMFQREEVYADQAAEEEREAGKHCFVSLADLGEAFA